MAEGLISKEELWNKLQEEFGVCTHCHKRECHGRTQHGSTITPSAVGNIRKILALIEECDVSYGE